MTYKDWLEKKMNDVNYERYQHGQKEYKNTLEMIEGSADYYLSEYIEFKKNKD